MKIDLGSQIKAHLTRLHYTNSQNLIFPLGMLILGKNLSNFVPPLENSTTRITIICIILTKEVQKSCNVLKVVSIVFITDTCFLAYCLLSMKYIDFLHCVCLSVLLVVADRSQFLLLWCTISS